MRVARWVPALRLAQLLTTLLDWFFSSYKYYHKGAHIVFSCGAGGGEGPHVNGQGAACNTYYQQYASLWTTYGVNGTGYWMWGPKLMEPTFLPYGAYFKVTESTRYTWDTVLQPGFPRMESNPEQYPADMPVPAAWRNPWIDPMQLPPGAVVPDPAPPPYPAIPNRPMDNPSRAPGEQTTRGPSAAPRTRPIRLPWRPTKPGGTPRPVIPVVVSPNPGVEIPGTPTFPVPRVEITPNGPRVLPGAHGNKKPPRPTKEKKLILALGKGWVKWGANMITEFDDFTAAIYNALPRNRRPWRHTSLQEKLALVYDHYEEVDIKKAVQGLLRNELGDRIGGIAGKMSRGAKQRFHQKGYGTPTGLGLGMPI